MAAIKRELDGIETEIELANTNLRRARSDDEYAAIADGRDKLKGRAAELAVAVRAHEMENTKSGRSEEEIAKALKLLHRLTELAQGAKTLKAAGELFRRVNAQLFLKFANFQLKKRVVQRVAGGMVTFGSAEAPIEIYAGRTDHATVKIKNTAGTLPANRDADSLVSSGDPNPTASEKSIGNRNRDERI